MVTWNTGHERRAYNRGYQARLDGWWIGTPYRRGRNARGLAQHRAWQAG